MLAEIAEKHRMLELAVEQGRIPVEKHGMLQSAHERLQHAAKAWEVRKAEYARATERKIEASRDRLHELRREFETAAANLRLAIQHWHETHQGILSMA